MAKDIIKINPSDELATVIDRVLTHDSDNVSLVVSDDAYIAQNILNFRLLKREAESIGKKIIIITENPRIQTLASKAGLAVQERAEYSMHRTRAHSEGAASPEHAPRRSIEDILPPQKAETKSPGTTDMLRSISGREHDEEKPMPTADLPRVRQFEQKPPAAPAETLLHRREPAPEGTQAGVAGERSILTALLAPFTFLSKAPSGIWNFTHGAFVKNPSRAWIFLLATGVLGGFLFFAFGVLPRVTVTLYPKTIQDNMNFSLIADANISHEDYSKGVIPAQIMEERQENNFTYEATGEAEVNERARGQIIMYNECGAQYGDEPLVETTRLNSSGDKLFRTIETVVVPRGGSVVVDVIADETGEEYNISPAFFAVVAYSGDERFQCLYGESEQRMEGGFEGMTSIVTETDLENAQKQINEEFVPGVEAALRERVPENLMMLDGSFETRIETIEFSAEAGEPAETFGAHVIVNAGTFLVQADAIGGAIAHHFVNSTQYSASFELSDERSIQYNVKEIDFEQGYAEFTLDIEQIFARRIDTGEIVDEIKSQNEVEVRRILSSRDELKKSQIRFWPFWVNKVPSNEVDITIEIQHEPALQLD